MNTATLVMDATPEITATEVTDRKSWDALFAFANQPHFAQSWCHGEGMRAEGWVPERVLFSDAEGIAALCQLLVRSQFGAKVNRIERGPVFLREDPSPELRLAVMRALRRRWRFGWNGLLLLTPSLPAGDASSKLLRDAGFWRRKGAGWQSSTLDLHPPLEELRARMTPGWRARIGRAEKDGVGLRLRRDPAAIDWLLERHAADLRAHRLAGPSPEFIREACAASPGDFWLLQAMIEGEPQAGLLVGRFGSHAEILIGWSGETTRRATAGHFLIWNAAIEMQRAGCRTLDLGGGAFQERYGHFKRGLRGTEYPPSGEWLAF